MTGVARRQQWQRRHGDGDRGGTETAAAAVARRQRWGWYSNSSGGTERAVAVARRGWADGVGSASLWAGSRQLILWQPSRFPDHGVETFTASPHKMCRGR